MTRILYILLLLSFCTVSYAQQVDPTDMTEIDKPAAPKVIQKASTSTYIDQMPEYPGGHSALLNYLNANVRYPDLAKKSNIQGKVVVTFVIDEEGYVIDEKVTRSIGGGCDEETLRVVKGMARWKPGFASGKPVKVYYTLPMDFKLEK